MSILSLSVHRKCEIRARACSFKLTFLHKPDICILKSSLLSILIPNNLIDLLHVIDSPDITADISSAWLVMSNNVYRSFLRL